MGRDRDGKQQVRQQQVASQQQVGRQQQVGFAERGEQEPFPERLRREDEGDRIRCSRVPLEVGPVDAGSQQRIAFDQWVLALRRDPGQAHQSAEW